MRTFAKKYFLTTVYPIGFDAHEDDFILKSNSNMQILKFKITSMYIFNITYLVSDKAHEAWLEWIREENIPFMLSSSYLSQPQVARVITNAKEEGTSFSVQFHVQDMHMLKLWNKEYSLLFKENCTRKFGTEVMFFTTVLELLNLNYDKGTYHIGH